MASDDKSRKAVGVYDRPAGADRKRGPALAIFVALIIALAWVAYYVFSRG